MLKKIFAGIVTLALVFSVGVSSVQARTNNNDAVVSLSQQHDNIATKLLLPAISAATSTVLVDLSDTTNFKHFSTGSLEISQIQVDWSTEVVATTTLKFGLLASTTASGALADVYWFDEVSFTTGVTGSALQGRQSATLDYTNSVIKLNITSGAPASFLTSDKALVNNTFATSTKISSPVGLTTASSGSFPNSGDLVMQVYSQAGTATTSVTTLYRAR